MLVLAQSSTLKLSQIGRSPTVPEARGFWNLHGVSIFSHPPAYEQCVSTPSKAQILNTNIYTNNILSSREKKLPYMPHSKSLSDNHCNYYNILHPTLLRTNLRLCIILSIMICVQKVILLLTSLYY